MSLTALFPAYGSNFFSQNYAQLLGKCLNAYLFSCSRNRREDKNEMNVSRSRSVDSSIQSKSIETIISSSTDSAVYSNTTENSVKHLSTRKPSQSLRDISHLFHYFSLSTNSNSTSKPKSKTLSNIRRKKMRKTIHSQTFLRPSKF